MSDIDEYNRKGSGYLRLPETIRPSYYKLSLVPWLEPTEGWRLEGSLSIIITCIQSTNQIILHSLNSTITATRLFQLNEKGQVELGDGHNGTTPGIPILKTQLEETRGFYVITLTQSLQVGTDYQLNFDYTTTIGDDTTGFYRSSYIDPITNSTKCGKIY